MNTHPVRAAVDLVDAEPSTEFLSALRAQLLAESTGASAGTIPQPLGSASDPVEEYVMIAPSITRTGPNRRLQLVAVAVAARAAALAAIFVINRPNDDLQAGELRDVDPEEAVPLGEAAMIGTEVLGGTDWHEVDNLTLSDYERETAAINAATPECAQLASVGLTLPTTKSVLVHQDFLNGHVPMLHDVWVFATPEDASRAMDVIAGDVFPTCSLKLFDRFTALNRDITAVSTSTVWAQAPPIALHGDQQVIIGQKIEYTFLAGGAASVEAINAYVQVGRAIAFIDPQYLSDVSPDSNVERTIAASTDALEKVFGH